jgi:hypothetical protein
VNGRDSLIGFVYEKGQKMQETGSIHPRPPHRGKRDADEAMIAALVLGAGQETASRHAGVCRRTLERRLLSPEFQRKLAADRAEIVRRAIDKAASYGLTALDKLYELMGNPNGFVALGAAKTLVEASLQMSTVVDVQARLEALETKLTGRRPA